MDERQDYERTRTRDNGSGAGFQKDNGKMFELVRACEESVQDGYNREKGREDGGKQDG